MVVGQACGASAGEITASTVEIPTLLNELFSTALLHWKTPQHNPNSLQQADLAQWGYNPIHTKLGKGSIPTEHNET